MSESRRNAIYGLTMLVLVAVLAVVVSTEPVEADRVQAIGSHIKCPVCQGESIADSPAQLARDMMQLVEERVREGATDQQIVDEVLASYSGAVLLDPPPRGNTLILWLAPGAALILGIATIVWWRRHPSDGTHPAPRPRSRSRARLLVGGLVLVGAVGIVVVTAVTSLGDEQSPNAGVAAGETQDLSDVSNETMEAMIAANSELDQVIGMRLALAERYFNLGDYQAAFPHYLAVAEAPTATEAQAATALVRLGWMAYEGNGEVETAIRLLDQALIIAPDSVAATYLKGRVLWCGAGDVSKAVELFQTLLGHPRLSADFGSQIRVDIDRVTAGKDCN